MGLNPRASKMQVPACAGEDFQITLLPVTLLPAQAGACTSKPCRLGQGIKEKHNGGNSSRGV